MNRVFAATASGTRVSRAVFLFTLFGVLAVFGLSCPSLQAESARSIFKHGQSAEARGDYDTAYNDYLKAHNLKPTEAIYRTSLYRVRVTDSSLHVTKGRKLLVAGNEEGALEEFLRAAAIDPGNEEAQQSIAAVRSKSTAVVSPVSENSVAETAGQEQEIDAMGGPAQLKPLSTEPLTLHMTEDAKIVYQAIGKAAGVNVLFDPDYHSDRIQVDLNNVSLLDALRIVGTISGTFWRPVTNNTIFVAKDTRAKRTELDEEAVQTFYLSNAWQQNDLTDVQTAIRNVLTNVRAYAVAGQNAIVIRGTPDELLLAQKLIDDLDKPRPEVVVDIAILEVSKNWERTLGIAWPQSAGVSLQTSSSSSSSSSTSTSTTSTTSTVSPTLYDLAHLKASNFAVTVGSATANMLLSDASTKILQNPQIRATDGQKAILKIGSKIPIATGSYQSGVGSVAGVSPLAETQFQYQDVGVDIEMTPTVHFDDDVTLKIKIEVTAESGQSTIEGVTEPIISQRTVDQVIRLREGEASILGGIQEQQDNTSWSGIPGLSSIPVLKYLFGSKDHTITDDELVFLVVPHIVRSQSLSQVNLRTIDTGEGQSIELREVPTAAPASNALPEQTPLPVGEPAAGPQSRLGGVPSPSAMAAAPEALAQMHEAAQMNGSSASTAPRALAQMTANAAGNHTPATVTPVAAPVSVSAPPGVASFALTALPGPVPVGSTFMVPLVLNGATNVGSVPLQIKYDASKMALVNVGSGNFLNRDGQPVALLHRDDGPGNLTVVASRPPGAAGVSGTGVICVLSFQAKAAGAGVIAITHPGLVSSTQKQLQALGGQISVQVK